MIEIDDLEQHLKSEEQERVLARAASTPSLRNIHLALAERHAKRVAQVQIEEASGIL